MAPKTASQTPDTQTASPAPPASPVVTEITYGANSFDVTKLPLTSVVALVRRGVAHYLGNEAASKAIDLAKASLKANLGEGAGTDAIDAAYKAMSDDDKGAFKAQAVKDFVENILSGDISTGRGRNANRDPITVAAEEIATRELNHILKANGIKKADEMEFAGGVKVSWADLLAKRLNGKEAGRIMDEAKAKVEADKAKAAEAKAKAKPASAGPVTVEDLGL